MLLCTIMFEVILPSMVKTTYNNMIRVISITIGIYGSVLRYIYLSFFCFFYFYMVVPSPDRPTTVVYLSTRELFKDCTKTHHGACWAHLETVKWSRLVYLPTISSSLRIPVGRYCMP